MSILYDGLKEVQETRQGKYSQALRKSSLEKISVQKEGPLKAQAWKFKGVLAFLILLILAVSFAVFFALRSFSSREKEIKPVTKQIQLIQLEKRIKTKVGTTSPHKTSHHKIKKKTQVFSSVSQ